MLMGIRLRISIVLAPNMGARVKTISIQEAAEALGVSAGTIQLRLQRGDLKGIRTKTPAGSSEWRVFLSQKSADYAFALQRHSISFTEKDIIDPDDSSYFDQSIVRSDNWRAEEIKKMEVLAETLIKPLTDRIEAQALALREQAAVIEQQGIQLRLLSDLESKVRLESENAEAQREAAEAERIVSECYKEENAALRQQVSTLSEARNAKLEKIASLESELANIQELYKRTQVPWWKRLLGH
jgi:hypothetical protein